MLKEMARNIGFSGNLIYKKETKSSMWVQGRFKARVQSEMQYFQGGSRRFKVKVT